MIRRALIGGAAALAASIVAPALAVDLPTRKAGLWEITIETGAAGKGMTMSQCTDAATDKDMATTVSPMAQEMCSRNEMQKTSTGYSGDAVCKIGGKTMISKSEITGDFQSAYTVRVTSTNDGVDASTMVMNARWTGACKADQKPGDIIMPGGMKMNVKDMQAMKGMAPKR